MGNFIKNIPPGIKNNGNTGAKFVLRGDFALQVKGFITEDNNTPPNDNVLSEPIPDGYSDNDFIIFPEYAAVSTSERERTDYFYFCKEDDPTALIVTEQSSSPILIDKLYS